MKVKVTINNRETTLSKFLDSLEKTKMKPLVTKSMDIIQENMKTVVHSDAPEPEVITPAFRGMTAEYTRSPKTMADLASMRINTNDFRYKGDKERMNYLINSVTRLPDQLSFDNRLEFMRDYFLVDDISRPGFARANFKNKIEHSHEYLDLHLKGFSYVMPDEVKKGGLRQFVSGRDILISSYLLSLYDIDKLIKKTLLRNMGIY